MFCRFDGHAWYRTIAWYGLRVGVYLRDAEPLLPNRQRMHGLIERKQVAPTWFAKDVRGRLHQLAPLLQGIAAPVRPLCLIADRMGECGLGNLTRETRALACPIPERAAEAVNGHVLAQPPSGPVRARSPAPRIPFPAMLMRWLDWFFRDRRSGEIVIAQWPNLPLWVFGITAVIAMLTAGSSVGFWTDIASRLFLAWLAGDEVLRGVNPFRRCLGAAVLIGLAVRLAL